MAAVDEKEPDTQPVLHDQSSSLKSTCPPEGKNSKTDVVCRAPELDDDIAEAIRYAETMSSEDVNDCLRHVVETYDKDPNYPSKSLALIQHFLNDELLKADYVEYANAYALVKVEAALVINNSPYPEVRAVVSNRDDPKLPALTARAAVIGLLYVCAGSFLNQFFSIRQPGIYLSSNVAQLLAYPLGKFADRTLPTTVYKTFGYEWSLNPGPFNMKEHMVITIMANVGFNNPYTVNVVWVQFSERFFNQPWAKSFCYQTLIALSTNFIGYGLAGVTRRFLVYPQYAIWPANLATIALNRAFHTETNTTVNEWRISRMRFFMYCFAGMFVYFWFPNYLFQAMAYFNWMTWIAPNNATLAAVTGGISGLGLNPLPTWDWNILTLGGDPLINPFFTMANSFAGALFALPIILALWYNNIWYTGFLPINSNGVFDNTGSRYNVSLIVNEDMLFDVNAFKAYSPAYLTAANLLVYSFFFAVYAATISHTFIYHRREIIVGFRNLFNRKTFSETSKYDIHSRLMSAYEEVPEWHYAIVLACSITVGALGVGLYPTHTSPAVVLYGILLAIVFCIPVGIIRAITNAEITLNVLAEFFGGLWFPGNANAMNFFKSYGYVTTAHTLAFAQDLKLAHYSKIPPKVTFWAQMVATWVSTFVSVGILNFQMTGIENVCLPTQKDRFTCPGTNNFFTASVLWGTLGPSRMFGGGMIYNPLIWSFLIGFALPIGCYLLRRKLPITKYFHLPVFLLGALIYAPFNLTNVWPAIPVGYLFNVYIKGRYLGWWSKYNYILTSAFSCAIAVSAIVQFFCVQYKGYDIDWPGNTMPFSGCDGSRCSRITLGEDGHFGPGVGEFD